MRRILFFLVSITLLLGSFGLWRGTFRTSAPAPAPPDTWRDDVRGMALGLYPRAAQYPGVEWPPDPSTLAHWGANTLCLPVSWSQWGLSEATLAPGRQTLDDEVLRTLIARGHALGMQVVISPMILIRGGQPHQWRGRISPREPELWWSEYRRFIDHYAQIAAEERAEALVVSHELTSLSRPEHAERWRGLLGHVRQRYRGLLWAIINHDALDAELPFEDFDRIGVSAYFPIAHSLEPSAEELRDGWLEAQSELSALSAQIRRPLTLFEVGYPSIDGGAMAPWDHTLGAPIDLSEQAMAYEAAVDAIFEMRSSQIVDGAIFWAWLGPGGPHDRWYTPAGKPAEVELRRFLRRR